MRAATVGLFSRKARTKQPSATSAAPVIIGDEDLDRAGPLLRQFEQAMGTDAPMRAAILAIAKAGGAPSMEQALRAGMDTGFIDLNRPWRWLAALAREAQRREERELLAHLALFVAMWVKGYNLRLTLADRMDLRLDSPPPELLGEIFSVALVEIAKLDPDAIVVDHITGRVTIQDLLLLCAVPALELPPGLVEPQALARAQAVVG